MRAARLLLALLPACSSLDVATIRVDSPSEVRVEDGAKVVVPAGSGNVETRLDRWPNVGPADVVRRTASGAVELDYYSAQIGNQHFTLVDEEGHVAATRAQLLPQQRGDAFRVKFEGNWPSQPSPHVVLATPWSNVRDVTVRHERQPVIGWLAMGVGAALGAGGAVLFGEGVNARDRTARDLELGSGVALTTVGLVVLSLGLYFLTTTPHERTWRPPSSAVARATW